VPPPPPPSGVPDPSPPVFLSQAVSNRETARRDDEVKGLTRTPLDGESPLTQSIKVLTEPHTGKQLRDAGFAAPCGGESPRAERVIPVGGNTARDSAGGAEYRWGDAAAPRGTTGWGQHGEDDAEGSGGTPLRSEEDAVVGDSAVNVGYSGVNVGNSGANVGNSDVNGGGSAVNVGDSGVNGGGASRHVFMEEFGEGFRGVLVLDGLGV